MLVEHMRITDKNEGQNLVFAGANGLLANFKVPGFPPVKPCFGSDLAGHRVVGLAAI